MELNSKGSSQSSLFDKTEKRELVKSALGLMLLDGRHCQNAEQARLREGPYL